MTFDINGAARTYFGEAQEWTSESQCPRDGSVHFGVFGSNPFVQVTQLATNYLTADPHNEQNWGTHSQIVIFDGGQTAAQARNPRGRAVNDETYSSPEFKIGDGAFVGHKKMDKLRNGKKLVTHKILDQGLADRVREVSTMLVNGNSKNYAGPSNALIAACGNTMLHGDVSSRLQEGLEKTVFAVIRRPGREFFKDICSTFASRTIHTAAFLHAIGEENIQKIREAGSDEEAKDMISNLLQEELQRPSSTYLKVISELGTPIDGTMPCHQLHCLSQPQDLKDQEFDRLVRSTAARIPKTYELVMGDHAGHLERVEEIVRSRGDAVSPGEADNYTKRCEQLASNFPGWRGE